MSNGFIEQYAPAAQAESARSGIPASIILAQAILESGWGDSGLVRQALNFFGIKADRSWSGDRYYATTTEYEGGKYVNTVAGFRSYDSALDSFADHSDFLLTNPRYANVFKTNDPKQVANELQKAGYATDPKYADKLINLIETYNLDQYDTGEPPKGGIVTAASKSDPGGGTWWGNTFDKIWGKGGYLDWFVPNWYSESVTDALNGENPVNPENVTEFFFGGMGQRVMVAVIVILLLVGVFFLVYKLIGGTTQ